jgi:hypothetical protein
MYMSNHFYILINISQISKVMCDYSCITPGNVRQTKQTNIIMNWNWGSVSWVRRYLFFCAEFCVRGKRCTSDPNLNISTSNPPFYEKQQINKKKQLYLHAVTRSYLYDIHVDSPLKTYIYCVVGIRLSCISIILFAHSRFDSEIIRWKGVISLITDKMVPVPQKSNIKDKE